MSVTGSHGMARFGPGFLLPQGSHPAPKDLMPGDPVGALISRGHMDVNGFLEWQVLFTTVDSSHLMEW